MGRVAEIWRGTRASLAWLAGAPVVNARIALSAPGRNEARARMARHFARFLETCRVSVEVDGQPPGPGTGCVLIYNETSFADVAAYGACMWDHVDRSAAADLYGYLPFARAAARKAGIELVARGNRQATDRLLGEMVAAVARGERLAWGGEGRLHGRDGVGKFKIGGALIAIRAQVPVIPVVFQGGHRAMPLGSVRARPGRIRIRFGTAIPTAGLGEDAARAFADHVQGVTAGIYADLKAASAPEPSRA